MYRLTKYGIDSITEFLNFACGEFCHSSAKKFEEEIEKMKAVLSEQATKFKEETEKMKAALSEQAKKFEEEIEKMKADFDAQEKQRKAGRMLSIHISEIFFLNCLYVMR
jgi:DNA anti-recombination protein RmuC